MATIYVREIPEYHLDGLPLGRHVEHDDRSRQYGFNAAGLPGQPLRPVRHQRFVPILDQGDLGSCTGNAAEGTAGTGVVFQAIPPGTASLPNTKDATAAEDQAVALYSAATRLDNIPGQWTPDDTGSTGLAAAKALKAAGLISGYQHTFNLQDALSALQIVPLLVGMNWYDTFDNPDANGLVKLTPSASVRGGHELCADELVPDQQLIGFANSWSASWGIQGRFYMSWDDFGHLLGEQADVIVPVPMTVQPPQPVPSPKPAPSPEQTIEEIEAAFWALAKKWANAHGFE